MVNLLPELIDVDESEWVLGQTPADEKGETLTWASWN